MSRTSVLLVDDHAVFIEALALRLGREPDLGPVRIAMSGAEAIAQLRRAVPDVTLLDVTLGTESGLVVAEQIKAIAPDCHILMLSAVDSPAMTVAALRAGARGWLPKTGEVSDVLGAIRGVIHGEVWLSRSLLGAVLPALLNVNALAPSNPLTELTAREQEILQFMVDGLTRPEIARRLGVTANTVRSHSQNLFAKLGAHSTLEAVAIALRYGLRASDT
jgi:DNA-binding NarL/FixJ family response regulator